MRVIHKKENEIPSVLPPDAKDPQKTIENLIATQSPRTQDSWEGFNSQDSLSYLKSSTPKSTSFEYDKTGCSNPLMDHNVVCHQDLGIFIRRVVRIAYSISTAYLSSCNGQPYHSSPPKYFQVI